MSHLIPNLKCHIERVSSLYLQGGDCNENIPYLGVELDRLKILSDVLNGKLTLKEASQALHLSYRQALDGKRVKEVVRGGVKQER